MDIRKSLLVAALVVTLLPSTALADGTGLDVPADPMAAGVETQFLPGMITHHLSAIEMARMALSKASRPEIRAFAQKVIDDQSREIAVMTHWLRDWYGMDPGSPAMMVMPEMPGMDMMAAHGMEAMQARMAGLGNKSGAEFDVEFMSLMTDHHAMALMMAAMVLIHGHHEDLYTLAEQIVLTQGEEIRQMDQWLSAWYGVRRAI